MDKIKAAGLPGFYTDERGIYGIVVETEYICCFIGDDGKYNVTVDCIDDNGDFAELKEWESFENHRDAIECLRRFVKAHKHYAHYC